MDGWVNVLFIVVVAVLYAVGALVKGAGAKGQKREGPNQPRQQQRETWQQRLARKAQEIQQAAEARTKQAAERMRGLEEKARQQQAKRMGAATGPTPPPQDQVTVRPARGGESIPVYEPGAPESTSERQRLAAQPQRTRKAVSAAGRRRVGRDQPVAEPTATSPRIEPILGGIPDMGSKPASIPAISIIDYGDPDALKKAILHYEILGKPLALRDPFRQAAGL